MGLIRSLGRFFAGIAFIILFFIIAIVVAVAILVSLGMDSAEESRAAALLTLKFTLICSPVVWMSCLNRTLTKISRFFMILKMAALISILLVPWEWFLRPWIAGNVLGISLSNLNNLGATNFLSAILVGVGLEWLVVAGLFALVAYFTRRWFEISDTRN